MINHWINYYLQQANDNTYVLSKKSLYVTDSTFTKYIRVHHDDNVSAIIDYTGKLYIRNEPNDVWVMRINSDYQVNVYYILNTTGIRTSSTIAITNNLRLSQVGAVTFGGIITSAGTIQANDNIFLATGKSLYVTN